MFGGSKKSAYLCIAFGKKAYLQDSWRDVRVVECAGLENRCTARYRGFESPPLRHVSERPGNGAFFLCLLRQKSAGISLKRLKLAAAARFLSLLGQKSAGVCLKRRR